MILLSFHNDLNASIPPISYKTYRPVAYGDSMYERPETRTLNDAADYHFNTQRLISSIVKGICVRRSNVVVEYLLASFREGFWQEISQVLHGFP